MLGVVLWAGSSVVFSKVPEKPSSTPQITREVVKEVETLGTFIWLVLKDGSEHLISSDGRFLIKNPRVLDLSSNRTIETLRELRETRRPNVKDYAFFYLSRQGKPAALIVVDPHCGHCERLVRDLLVLIESGRTPGYDLAVTFFPVFRRSTDDVCKLLSVSPEKAHETYVKWVKTGNPGIWEKLTCDPRKKQDFIMKAAKLRFISGINSTPVVILPDGRKVVGYRNPEEFLFEPSPTGSTESQIKSQKEDQK